MRTEIEIFRYQETLAHHRERAKQTIASTQPGSEEYAEAIKLFLRCDGAIQILNWVLELHDESFNLPPTIAQREVGK
jgi:hypothetical protein